MCGHRALRFDSREIIIKSVYLLALHFTITSAKRVFHKVIDTATTAFTEPVNYVKFIKFVSSPIKNTKRKMSLPEADTQIFFG